MWHLIIILPILGIIVFWLFPPGIAVPTYLIILLVSGVLYWSLARVMRKHPATGHEGLVGATARVVSGLPPDAAAQYTVRIKDELWNANSSDSLKAGEFVIITGVNGLILLVRRITSSEEVAGPT